MDDTIQRIQVLPESLCNIIAAGEVVERPSSVVKELVENAIDAGSTDILVEIEAGGKRLVKVADNGCGMTQDDAFLSLERHATSKIRSETDLFGLSTLGFRGEALPSIASVCRLKLTTRSAQSDTGWEIYAEGGSVKKAVEIGIPQGTTIEVRNLFFNMPARRKFMRAEQTEVGHVADVVTKQAMACPAIRFRLLHNGRTLLEAHPEKNLDARVANLLGRPVLKELLPLKEQTAGLALEGLVSQPALSRSASTHIYTFINGRYIRDRVVQHAVMEGYRNLLMKGRYPVAVLFLEMDPAQVDVNVHPTKHEVRFRDQRGVHDFISASIRQTLRGSTWLDNGPTVAPAAAEPEAAAPFKTPVAPRPEGEQPYRERVQESMERYLSSPPQEPVRPTVCAPGAAEASLPPIEADMTDPADFFSRLRVIGQYRQCYILCQDGDDLVLVDQHAAHERVRFEELRNQFRQRAVERQTLLFPSILEFDHREASLVAEHLEDFGSVGFEVEPFGRTSFALKAVPQLLAAGDSEALLRDVASELAEVGRSGLLADRVEEVLMLMACHGSVRANQALSQEEIAALLRSLDSVDFKGNCPHGRPVLVRLTLPELERLFKRS